MSIINSSTLQGFNSLTSTESTSVFSPARPESGILPDIDIEQVRLKLKEETEQLKKYPQGMGAFLKCQICLNS
jgi:hypothetical protein